jgi:hypothetical protein
MTISPRSAAPLLLAATAAAALGLGVATAAPAAAKPGHSSVSTNPNGGGTVTTGRAVRDFEPPDPCRAACQRPGPASFERLTVPTIPDDKSQSGHPQLQLSQDRPSQQLTALSNTQTTSSATLKNSISNVREIPDSCISPSQLDNPVCIGAWPIWPIGPKEKHR